MLLISERRKRECWDGKKYKGMRIFVLFGDKYPICPLLLPLGFVKEEPRVFVMGGMGD
jgi:hypothetical protein